VEGVRLKGQRGGHEWSLTWPASALLHRVVAWRCACATSPWHAIILALRTPTRLVRSSTADCQGEKFLDSLDDVAVSNVILIDGMAIWGPAKAVGLTDLKLWLAGWLQLYDVSVAVTASTATPMSNKVGWGGGCECVLLMAPACGVLVQCCRECTRTLSTPTHADRCSCASRCCCRVVSLAVAAPARWTAA
jgi:hypothetical protein